MMKGLFSEGSSHRIGAFAMVLALFAMTGCIKNEDSAETKKEEPSKEATIATTTEKVGNGEGGSEAATTAVDYKARSISINFYEEPKIMDPQKAQDTVALMLLSHVNEGLTRLDPSNKVFPAQAESWELKGKTEYVFKIRKDAKWSDGKPVRAQDFVYSWRRGVDPATASLYAFIFYPLKNAQAINEGKKKPVELGVKAVDDHTLQVNLERPTAYFLRLLAFGTYFPSRQDYVETYGEQYAADADKMLYNGPWVISQWKHNASIKLSKNEHYWNKENIWLNEINMPYLIRDKNSEYNMFKDGKFAMTWWTTKEQLPDAQRNKFQIRKYSPGSVWYWQLNTTRKITGNENFRKAIQHAMNRTEYVRQVDGIPGAAPIFGIIPDYMPGVNKRYGDEYSIDFKDADVAKAKEYLEKAKKELGLETFPPLSVLASDGDHYRRDMEYFQRYFKETLGLDLKLDFQTFKVRLERMDRKDFDIVYSGWGPDYLDAMSFADLFTSWNQNNNTGWSSKAYDDLIVKAQESIDPKERLDAMHEAEKLLVKHAPIVSFKQESRVYVQNPRLVGVIRRVVSPDPDFYYARITEPTAQR